MRSTTNERNKEIASLHGLQDFEVPLPLDEEKVMAYERAMQEAPIS